jgi:hypothetical protein
VGVNGVYALRRCWEWLGILAPILAVVVILGCLHCLKMHHSNWSNSTHYADCKAEKSHKMPSCPCSRDKKSDGAPVPRLQRLAAHVDWAIWSFLLLSVLYLGIILTVIWTCITLQPPASYCVGRILLAISLTFALLHNRSCLIGDNTWAHEIFDGLIDRNMFPMTFPTQLVLSMNTLAYVFIAVLGTYSCTLVHRFGNSGEQPGKEAVSGCRRLLGIGALCLVIGILEMQALCEWAAAHSEDHASARILGRSNVMAMALVYALILGILYGIPAYRVGLRVRRRKKEEDLVGIGLSELLQVVSPVIAGLVALPLQRLMDQWSGK